MEPETQVLEGASESKAVDYFVSRRGANAAVAQEVAQDLIDAGYTVIVQDFDIPHTANFVAAMHDALKRCRHLVVLLTKDYDASDFTLTEVACFLAAASRSKGERRLVVLRVDDCEPEGVFAGIVFADLVGVTDRRERKARILAAAEGRSTATPRRPKIFENVPLRDLNFTARRNVLAKLHKLLMSGEGIAAITNVAIHGLAGAGKTSLAAEFAYSHAGEYAGVWWAPASQRTSLIASLAVLASRLDPKLADEPNQEKAAREALTSLGRSAMPYLLVYDNVDSPEEIRDLIPSAAARVLVTTRWSDWGGQFAEVKLQPFTVEEGAELLEKRARRSEKAGAERLSTSLGGLPLALDHAGAYCKLTGMTFDAYREKLNTLISRAPKGAAYPSSVAATFNLAIEKAVAEHHAAEKLLGIFACFAPEPIPLDIINDDVIEEEDWVEALMALSIVSLIEHAPLKDGSAAINVHLLVQAAMLARIKSHQTADRAAACLERAFPQNARNDFKVWPRCAALLPHVLALRKCDPSTFLSVMGSPGDVLVSSAARLYEAAVAYLLGRRTYAEAEPLLRELLDHAARAFGPDHFYVARLQVDLASLYQSQRRYQEAETIYRRVLAISYANMVELGANTFTLSPTANGNISLVVHHPEFAARMLSFARLLEQTGRQNEAEHALRQALAIFDKSSGRQSMNSAEALLELADLLGSTSRRAEAEDLYREALAICERILGRKSARYATMLSSFASLLTKSGRTTEAEPLFKEAIATAREVYGSEHPELAAVLSQYGLLLARTNHLAEAEPLLREALSIDEKAVGHDDPAYGTALNNLATVLCQLPGRYVEGEPLFREALAICERTLGPEDPKVASTLRNIAVIYKSTDRMVEAVELYRRALAIWEKTRGPDSSEVGMTLVELGELLYMMKQYALAEPLLRRGLSIEENLGESRTMQFAANVGLHSMLLDYLGRFDEADSSFRRALAITESLRGREHPEYAICLSNYVDMLVRCGRVAEAEPLARQVIAIWSKAAGKDHPQLGAGQGILAEVLVAAGRPAEALAPARSALEIHEKALGAESAWTRRSARGYANVLNVLGRRQDAEALITRYGLNT